MMVDRSHEKDPFPPRLERCDLKYDRQSFDDEDAPDQDQQQLVFTDDRDSAERGPQG